MEKFLEFTARFTKKEDKKYSFNIKQINNISCNDDGTACIEAEYCEDVVMFNTVEEYEEIVLGLNGYSAVKK